MTAELDIASLRNSDTATLRAELSRGLKLTVEYLKYLAAIWSELEHRGEDLSDLKTGIGVYIAGIASEMILADTVVEFADRPRMLRKIASMTIEDQRVAIENGTVPINVGKKRQCSSRAPRLNDDKPGIDMLVKMAAAGNARDVAEVCARIVRASTDPIDTAWRLKKELDKIEASKQHRTLSVS